MILFKDIQQGKTYKADHCDMLYEVLFKNDSCLLMKTQCGSYSTYTGSSLKTPSGWTEVKPKLKAYVVSAYSTYQKSWMCFSETNKRALEVWLKNYDKHGPITEIELECP